MSDIRWQGWLMVFWFVVSLLGGISLLLLIVASLLKYLTS